MVKRNKKLKVAWALISEAIADMVESEDFEKESFIVKSDGVFVEISLKDPSPAPAKKKEFKFKVVS